MEEILGTRLPVFIGLTVILFGGAAFMTGEALAETWRPWWQAVPYSFLLGMGDRFMTYALFEGTLLAPWGYLFHSLVLLGITLAAYRLTLVHRMVSQYPWLYQRIGLFRWTDRRE